MVSTFDRERRNIITCAVTLYDTTTKKLLATPSMGKHGIRARYGKKNLVDPVLAQSQNNCC